MELAFQVIVNALITSAFYAVLAVGLTIVFGVMGTANYAHGEFYMVGGYTVWLLYAEAHWPFFAAVAVACLIVGSLGMLCELGLFRQVRRSVLAGFLISIGLMLILRVLAGEIWGVGLTKHVPPAFPGVLNMWGVTVPWQRLLIIPSVLFLLGAGYLFLTRTKLGRGVRACAQDRDAASLHGISSNTMALIVLGIGSAMAGAAGGLMAPLVAVMPYMGHIVIWMCFVIVIVGGAGNLKGALLASIFFGFLYSIVTTFSDSTIAAIVASVVMLIVLAIRPQGLMGYYAEE
ncbi:branched-chain amino acid ABC transporter permease [Chloroflexota bacterium]